MNEYTLFYEGSGEDSRSFVDPALAREGKERLRDRQTDSQTDGQTEARQRD